MSYEGADFLSETVFDAVVIGTGLGETVLAAALARAGKNVLHLDKHTFYGSTMSTHTLSEFKNLLSKQSAAVPTTPTPTAPTAKGIPLSVETTIGASESEVVVDIDTEREYSHGQKGARLLRSVSIDNVPSLLYADGVTVDTLLQNGVDRYLEFQSVGGCKMLINGCSALCPIPNSRAALFRDTTLTLLEKRKVANFLMDVMRRDAQRSGANIPNPERDTFLPSGSSSTSTSNSSNGACENDLVDNDRPLEDFLAGERFKIASPLVQEFLVYGIAMALTPRSVGAKDGVDRICQYARSTGRFKDTTTPFIYPIYGSGEVPQAFSREAAVFSATYMLGRKAAAVVPPPGEGEDAAEVVLEEGGVKVKAKWVAVGAECLYEKCGTKYQRCVVVTDGPVIETGEGKCSFEFVVVPPLLPTLSAVQILQFGSVTGVVPRGFCKLIIYNISFKILSKIFIILFIYLF